MVCVEVLRDSTEWVWEAHLGGDLEENGLRVQAAIQHYGVDNVTIGPNFVPGEGPEEFVAGHGFGLYIRKNAEDTDARVQGLMEDILNFEHGHPMEVTS